MKRFLNLGALLFFVVLGACNLLNPVESTPPPENPPVAQMLPDLPGYKTVEGETLTSYIGKAAGADVFDNKPTLKTMVTKADAVIACYQEAGAVRARLYSNQTEPWSAGAVVIGDKKAMLSPTNLFNCLGGGDAPGGRFQSQGVNIEPCSAKYTLPKDDNEFYIMYVGTTLDICQDFCSNLEGCTVH